MGKPQAAKGGKSKDERPLCVGHFKDGKPCTYKARENHDTCGRHKDGDGGGGRPSKIDDGQTATQIINLIKVGNYYEHAAVAAGISATTFYRWMEIGEADFEADKQTAYRKFWEAVTRAKSEGITAAVTALRKGMSEDWRAAVAFLERKDPENWGKKQRVEHSGPGGEPIKTARVQDLSKLSLDERRELKRLQEKLQQA